MAINKRARTRAAKKTPAYKPDDGPLTSQQIEAIKKIEPQGRMKGKSSLLPSLEDFRRSIKVRGTPSARLLREERDRK